MKQLRKIIMTVGLVAPMLFGHQQADAASTISVQMNGQTLYFDQPPMMENNHVLVPMRTIFEVVGADMQWDAQTSAVKAKKGDLSITLPLNSNQVTINGTERNLDVPAKSVNGRTLVPLRFVSETLGCKVDWIPDQSVVAITFDGEVKPPPTGKIYPDGWVAPVLKSSWNPDIETNYQTLQNELGFEKGGRRYSIVGQTGVIQVIYQGPDAPFEFGLRFTGWDDSNIPQSYRVPIVAKELFKLFFKSDATRVWNYLNSGHIPDDFTANGRNVHARVTSGLYLEVGYKQ